MQILALSYEVKWGNIENALNKIYNAKNMACDKIDSY